MHWARMVAGGARRVVGRPRKLHPVYVCERLLNIRRILARSIPKSIWVHLNRPMSKAYDVSEEKQRRREYAAILQGLANSQVTPGNDPDGPDDLPQLILEWQYSEGLLVREARCDSGEPWSDRDVGERQFECAHRLSLFIVARQAGTSPEYLRRVCRKHDPPKADEFGEEERTLL
jgi:hypothetical protein